MNFVDGMQTIVLTNLRSSAPLIFAAIGGIFSERCGVINIALEGKMIFGAFCAAAAAYYFQNPWVGFLAGGLAGVCAAFLYGIFVIFLRSNQIVAGTALTLLAMGVVPFLSQIFFQDTGSTPEVPFHARLVSLPIYFAWITVFLVWAIFKLTPFGMWTKFAGEHPSALQSSGIDVIKVRLAGVLLSGFFAGLGGATLSICLASGYTRNMTAGRGYMALAALIVGGWKPVRTLVACLLFGLFDAIGITLQGTSFVSDPFSSNGSFVIARFFTSTEFIQMIPYILTIVVVSGFVGRSLPPRALGQFFQKN